MRLSPLLLLALLFAGCSGPADPAETLAASGELVTPPPFVLADGTFTWHEVPTTANPATALVAYNIVTQSAVNPCSYEGGAYFNNRPIPIAGGNAHRHRNGTLRISFDWTEADYALPTLVAGYRAPGMAAVVDSPRIARGETVEVRIDGIDPGSGGGWQLFACLNRSSDYPYDEGWQPGPFLGEFTVHAEFQGDPEPPLPPADVPDQRTSRDG